MKKRKLIICLVFIMFLFLTSCKIICEIQGHNYMFISNNNGSHNLICTYDATHMEVENCDFSEWEVVKEAKPFEEGKEERICSKCNYKEERIIPATHQHEYSDEWIVDKEATCTEKGLKSHHCINEGCTSKIEETEIDVKEHDYGEWEVVVEVKCETNGFEQRKCKDCSFTDTRVVNKLGHDEIKYEMLAPTCTETGYNEYVICSRCDYTTYIELAALGHDEIKHEEKAATCTEYGYESYVTCTRCDYTTYVEIAAFGHNYSDEWTVDIEPSEENVGSKAKYCINERCLEKKDVTEIPKLPYSDGLLYELNSMKNGYIVKGIGEFDGTKLYITPVYNNLPVVEIAVGSFKNCTSLVNIAIPNSVESIGYKAFEGCSSLTSISIPFVGENADGSGTTKIGSLFGFDSVPKTLEQVAITGGTSIASFAFEGCSSLTSIIIPNSVESIGYSAFEGCSSLTSIEIPNSVESIGYSAFEGCSSLTSIIIPNSVESIGHSAFEGCSSLTSIEIPNSVENIDSSVFEGCSSLTSIEIPNSVESIGYSAFKGCSSLTSISIPFVGEKADGSGLTSFGFIFGRDSVPKTLEKVIITGGKIIGSFSHCSSITSIVITNSIETIDEYAFSGCSSLSSIQLPSSLKSIETWAFNECASLKEVYYDGTIDEWNKITFADEKANPMYYAENLYVQDENGEYYLYTE